MVNGTIANIEDFPYIVHTGILNSNGGYNSVCGGSLISDRIVITAAHCLTNGWTTIPADTDKIQVSPGGIEVFYLSRSLIRASSVYIHPDYDPISLKHDIGIIELTTPIKIPTLKYAKIYSGTIIDNMKLFAAGWGRTIAEVNTSFPTSFMQVEVYISSDASCKNLNPDWSGNNHDQICSVVRNSQGVCKGDSGGPLIYKNNEENALVGIISFTMENPNDPKAIRCGNNNDLMFFTHVSWYFEWLSSILHRNISELTYTRF